jgi:hypothetical protein
MSTAFPQPKPGMAPAPGPMKVPADRLRSVLGIASVSFVSRNRTLAIVDSSLSGENVTPSASVAMGAAGVQETLS